MERLLQTPKPPRVPEFYTLTKIHKPKPVGRPIISGCDGPTERISAFVDRLIQPIAKIQNLYIKNRTDFILHQVHRTQKTSTEHATSYNGCNSSRYTNIPQEQGMQIYARHTTSLYLQRHGTSMGTKAAVAFANIFMAEIETQILRQSKHKPPQWIRYIDDIASLWVTTKDEVLHFIQKAFLTNSTQKSNLRLKYQRVGKATF